MDELPNIAEFDGEDQKLFSWGNGKIETFKGISSNEN